ncbi:hypothetical protein MHYP_G00042320 [Metynnis hypsauchen]
MDIREDVEDQEGRIISFYKVPKVDWARPLYCKLEGNGTSTVLFEGQVDHLVPSTSQVLVQSDLFLMAGRVISHSFLHSGLLLAGLSPAIIHVLLGGSPQTATILLEDVVDTDIRETLQLVLTQTSRQIKQLRQGLKESMMWPLLEASPDVVPVIFPRHSTAECNAQVVLDNIIWPSKEETDNDDDGFPIPVKFRIAGYVWQFVETDIAALSQLETDRARSSGLSQPMGTQQLLRKTCQRWRHGGVVGSAVASQQGGPGDSGYVAEQPNQETDVICMDSCPVCGEQFAAEIMPYHASSRGESFPPMNSTMMNRNVTEEVHHYQWLLHLKTVLLAFALLAQQNRGRGPKFHKEQQCCTEWVCCMKKKLNHH